MTFLTKLKYAPFYLLSLIPFRILYFFSDLLYFAMYYFAGYRKKVVRKNLQQAFKELSQDEIRSLEKKFYRHFCDVLVESLKALSISEKNLLKRFKVINPELVNNHQSPTKSFILFAAHLGNWEWFLSMPLFFNPRCLALYLPLRNKYFNKLIVGIRGRFGVQCAEAHRSYKVLMNYSNQNVNTITLYIADQSPHRDAKMHWTKFLNRDTPFNTGINAMATKLRQVVIFPYFRLAKRGYYEIELKLIWDGESSTGENEIIDKFASCLETAIHETPYLWLWTHKRWKHGKN